MSTIATGAAASDIAARAARRRRGGAWLAIALVLAAVGAGSAALTSLGDWTQRDALDPASAGPTGTRALAEILREQGVRVDVARDRGAADRALASGAPSTLVITDTAPLSDDALDELRSAAVDVVLIDPHTRDLRTLLTGSSAAGFADDALAAPDCTLEDARRAGPITPWGVYAPAGSVIGCYPSADGYGLLVASDGDGRVAALDGGALLSNENLAENGNAALALNLMGRHATLVWYMPALADADRDAGTGIGALTPSWVTPAIVVLIAAALSAALWRGRRFGPLVAENLPVTVRAAETTEGRARLYARANDPVHAADQLRMTTVSRLATLIGLDHAAPARDIADAVAARLGADRRDIHDILFDTLPTTDADLVAIADRLDQLEAAVHRAVRPERNPS